MKKITLRVISFVIHTQVYINVGLEIREEVTSKNCELPFNQGVTELDSSSELNP